MSQRYWKGFLIQVGSAAITSPFVNSLVNNGLIRETCLAHENSKGGQLSRCFYLNFCEVKFLMFIFRGQLAFLMELEFFLWAYFKQVNPSVGFTIKQSRQLARGCKPFGTAFESCNKLD